MEKLTCPQLLKKFPAYYGSRMFWQNSQDPATVYILRQIKPVHVSSQPSLKNNLNIAVFSTHRSSKWPLFFRSPHRNHMYTFLVSHTCNIPRPFLFSWFNGPNDIWWGVHSWSASPCSLLGSPVTSYLLGPNIFLGKLFSNTHSFWNKVNCQLDATR